MAFDSEQLLAVVALVTATANAIALIIHAMRVPYRESDRVEQTHALEQAAKVPQDSSPATAPGRR